MHLTTLVPIAITLFLFFFLFLFACALVVGYRAITGGGQEKERPSRSSTAPRATVITPGGRRSSAASPHSRRLSGQDQQKTPLTIPGWRWPSRPDEPSYQ